MFSKLHLFAILRWPGVDFAVELDLRTKVNEAASTLHLVLSVPRPDGTQVEWRLDVWIGPEVVSVTGGATRRLSGVSAWIVILSARRR